MQKKFHFGNIFLPKYFNNFQIAQISQKITQGLVLIDVSDAHLEDIQTIHHTQSHAQPALHIPPLMKLIEHVVSAF